MNDANYEGDSALMEAATGGHMGVVKELIDSSANITSVNNMGETAMSRALECGHAKLVKC